MERWRVAADRARQQSEEEITAIQRKLSDPLSEWEPELCVRLLRSPGVTNFSAIRQRLQRCTRAWMREFLELEGLDVLFTALKRLRDNGLRAVALQLECVACIRVIMNSRTGLTSIIEHQEYCVKLVKALDTKNLAVKKQLFELLSALSTYSIRGHAAVLEALDKYKIFKGFRYRFKVLMMEMQQAEHTPYKAVLLGFVNCLILCTEELHRRIRMRDEFITLGLLEIVDSFRNEDDDELAIQIEAFDENKHKDEEQAELLGILLRGDHYEFFQNIFNKNRVTQTSQRRHNIEESASSQIPAQTPSISAEVQDSPIALPFLLLLQNLSQLDPNSPESEQVWELLEKVSSKAVNGGLEHLNRGLNFHILMLNKKDEATQTPKMRRTPKPDFLCDAKVNAETQTELTPLPFQDRRNAIKRHGHSRQHVLSSDSGEEVFYDSQQVIVTPEHNESKSMENVVLSRAGLHNEQEEFQPRPFPHSSLPAPPADDAPLPPVPFNSSISSLKEEISADDSDNTLNKAEQLTVPAPVDDNFPPSPYMSRALPLSPPPPLPSVPPSTTCLTSNINENVQSIPPPPSHSPPPPPCPMDSSSNNIPLPPPLPPSSDSSQLIHATKYINNLSTDKRIDPYTTPPPPPPPPLFSPLTALNRSSEHLNLSPSLHQCIKTPSSGYQSLPSPFFSSILSENDSTSSPCNTIPSSTTTSSPLVPIGNSHLSTPVSPSMLSETIPCNNSYPIPFPQIMKDDSLSIPPPPPLPTLFPVSSENNIPPPPPPMPPSSGSCIPPPPPPMPLQSTNFGHALSPSLPAGSSFPPPPPPLPMETGSIGPPPPPFPNSVLSENASPLPHSNVHSSLYGEGNFTRPNYLQLKSLPPSIAAALARSNPYATLPRPRHKMKTLNWTKVPSQLIEDESVWKAVHTEISPNIQLDYDKVEELFCQKQSAGKAATTTTTTTTKQKKELSEITLLDSKRSLNINIFLKQFKCSLDELSSLIRTGKGNEIGAERLRGILKILPEREELELVKSFNGDVEKLGTAEKFILHMGQLPAFGLRIEALLQREEFYPSIETIRPQLDAIKTTQEDLLTNKALKEFLALVLHTGNFLNAGSYAGNAAGFKLNTLPKLYETRANKARVTLLHFLVEAAERENAEMLNFTTDMKYLAQVSRISFEGLVSEIKSIANGINKLENQLKIAPSDVETQFQNFVEKAKKEIRLLENDLDEIDQTSKKLARHFCEDEKKFKLEDCFTTFSGFCEKVKQAKIENDQRKKQEERLARIQEQRKKKPPNKLTHTDSSLFSQDEVSLIDKLLSEIKEGSFKLRKTTMSASQA